jgi:hypothetical protein
MTKNQQEDLRNVNRRRRAAFAYDSRKLGHIDLAIMKSEPGGADSESQLPYHASPAGRKIIDDTLAELLYEDVIEESDSLWASPAILVQQKGKDRFYIDFRKVNEVTKADQYPVPRIDDVPSQYAGKSYFTTFDANKGFHEIGLDRRIQKRPPSALTGVFTNIKECFTQVRSRQVPMTYGQSSWTSRMADSPSLHRGYYQLQS